ncbi:hypothetical protein LguiB_033256 [Lonicera macranthoides]
MRPGLIGGAQADGPDLASGAPGLTKGAPGLRAGVSGLAASSAHPFHSFDDRQHGPCTTHTQHSLHFYTIGASSSNKRRGVLLGKKTAAITKEKGRSPVTYDDSLRGPPTSVHSQFVTNLLAYIKDRCPMLHSSWYDLPVSERTRLLDFLSVMEVRLSRRLEGLGRFALSYRVRTSACGVAVVMQPLQDPEFQKKSEQMKAIRASTKKRPHIERARTFAARAEEHKKRRTSSSLAGSAMSDEAVASLMASMPPIKDTSDGFSPASVIAPPRLPIDVEIEVMERADPTNAALEEELATLRENQKQLEKRIQQQERDRQDREREQQEREREWLEWKARI